MKSKEHGSYEVRDVVLAKVRGFPPWPGMIVDPDSVPLNVTKERPPSKKTSFYCVRFFPVGDYAWLVAKDISKLQTHEIEAYINEPVKRSGDLLTGYKIALDPATWEAEREAALAENAEAEANAEVDQLASEGEGGEKKSGKTKKRKRDTTEGATKKVKKDGGEKNKKNKKKSKTMVESEDDGGEEPEPEEEEGSGSKKAPTSPPSKKSKRDKDEDDWDATLLNDPEAVKVREWRHKLQKTFLSSKITPKEEEMPEVDKLFNTVEQYDKMSIQYLSFSKIGKVMRHITALPNEKIPRDSEFAFRERAKVLVDRWQGQLNNSSKTEGANGAAPAGDKSDAGNTSAVGDVTMSTA